LLGSVLRIDAEGEFSDVERLMEMRISSLGVDSLMATELRNQLRAWVGVDIPLDILVGGGRVAEVVKLVHQKALLESLSHQGGEQQSTHEDSEVFVL
jgi:hypothetical protein